jgi:hypothetical protein
MKEKIVKNIIIEMTANIIEIINNIGVSGQFYLILYSIPAKICYNP